MPVCVNYEQNGSDVSMRIDTNSWIRYEICSS